MNPAGGEFEGVVNLMSRSFRFLAILIGFGVATDATAIGLSVDQTFPLNGAPVNAEGIAVIYEGANAGIYIPHRDTTQVTVLDVETGAFIFNFNSVIPLPFGSRGLRAIDVLPNGNLIIGQHTSNLVREVIIPPKPALPTDVPTATLGTISFTLPSHTVSPAPFDEFESIAAFQRPSDGQLYLLIGEEGREIPDGSGTEVAGEVYLGTVSGAGLGSFERLIDVPLDAGYDDISGLDVISIVFDLAGNIDRAASRIAMTDDSSANPISNEPQSGLFVLNLLGQVLESLDGPGDGVEEGFEEVFGQPTWRDAEGLDVHADSDGDGPDVTRIVVLFGNAGGITPTIVTFDEIVFEEVPEPATFGLVGLGLVALAIRRARR